MLKECKIFTTYRQAELQRISTVSPHISMYIAIPVLCQYLQDYKSLDESVKDVREKIDQRMKDLERAHSTSTSDPSARDDITDVGDMEIESDGEGQDSKSQSSAPKLLMSTAPGMIVTPPMATYPQQHPVQPSPPTIAYQGQAPPLPNGQHMARPEGPHFQGRGVARPLRVMTRPLPPPGRGPGMTRPFPPPGRGLGMTRPLPPQGRGVARPLPPQGRGMARPLPPQGRGVARPPPPLQGQSANYSPVPPPRKTMPPFRVPPIIRPPVNGPPDANQPHTISSSAVIYNRPSQPAAAAVEESMIDPDHAKPSLDERLKDMLLNKKFGGTVLKEQDDSKAYSPTENDHALMNNDGEMGDLSPAPTPSPSDSPETSPKPNMDNPILKALYKSRASPEPRPASLVPDYDENDELSSSDLKNILNQVISSEPANTRSPDGTKQPLPGKPAIPTPSDIKITPTLTNLLDEIFPKISQSLMNRKRKQEESDNTPSKPHLDGPPGIPSKASRLDGSPGIPSKVSRLDGPPSKVSRLDGPPGLPSNVGVGPPGPPRPYLPPPPPPPPQQTPLFPGSPRVRPPFERPRFPPAPARSPYSPGGPMHMPNQGVGPPRPRPFSPYERPPSNHMMENSHGQHFSMRPNSYQKPRLYNPAMGPHGYRQFHPRYV